MNITDQLAELRRGRFYPDVQEAMADVLQGVMQTKKKGSVTITIEIAMEGQEEDQVNVTGKIAKKRPQRDPAKTPMFVNPDLTLTKTDPKQKTFGEVETVDVETGEIIDPGFDRDVG